MSPPVNLQQYLSCNCWPDPASAVDRTGWRRRREAALLDVVRLRESFARVAMHGDALPLFFYSDLFIKHPEVPKLFPVSMAAQRGHLVDALQKIVSHADLPSALPPSLQPLCPHHRTLLPA